MNRLFYIWTTRLCLALLFLGITPNITSPAMLVAQSKKKNPAQASKYAKRGNAKAKKIIEELYQIIKKHINLIRVQTIKRKFNN